MSGDLGRRPIFLISTASHDLQCSIYQPGRPLCHGSLSSTMVPAEKVRPQFLSLRHCLCFCTLHTNAIPRHRPIGTGRLRAVDLDIGANKSDIRAVKVVTIRSAPAELEPATARWSRSSYGKR
jgi:hypothetical protein